MNKKELFLLIKKRKLLIIFSFILILLSFFLLSIYGPLWKIWPKAIVANIANNRLAVLLYKNPYCKDDCYYIKASYLDLIYLNLNNYSFYNKLINIVLDNNNNLDYRIELADILLLYDFNNKQELFVKKISPYIDNNLLSIELSSYIILNSNNSFDYSNYINLLSQLVKDDNLPLEKRQLALKYLSYIPLSDYSIYLNLLNSLDCQILTEQVLFSLAKYVSQKSFDYHPLIYIIENKFFSFNLHNRSLALFLLADISHLQDVDLYLQELYQHEELDEFNGIILADILNRD